MLEQYGWRVEDQGGPRRTSGGPAEDQRSWWSHRVTSVTSIRRGLHSNGRLADLDRLACRVTSWALCGGQLGCFDRGVTINLMGDNNQLII